MPFPSQITSSPPTSKTQLMLSYPLLSGKVSTSEREKHFSVGESISVSQLSVSQAYPNRRRWCSFSPLCRCSPALTGIRVALYRQPLPHLRAHSLLYGRVPTATPTGSHLMRLWIWVEWRIPAQALVVSKVFKE